jgi:hypothetical protein
VTDENHTFVSWGRYDAEHQAVLGRIVLLEQQATALRNSESVHNDFQNRITELEQLSREELSRGRSRRDRAWLIVLGLMTGIVCPLVLAAVFTLLHLHGH